VHAVMVRLRHACRGRHGVGHALLVDTAHGLSASTGVGTTAHGWLDVAARTNWMVGIFAQRPKKVYSTA
jgi:hypothetical protein